jgi:hypothetical protein
MRQSFTTYQYVVETMEERQTTKPPYNSGYPEQRPEPNRPQQREPDAKTPHEPQNAPSKKPYPSSSSSG